MQAFVPGLAGPRPAPARFVDAGKAMHPALEKRGWTARAKDCNGPGNTASDYDGKLGNAHHARTSRR